MKTAAGLPLSIENYWAFFAPYQRGKAEMVDIEETIRATMKGAHQAPPPPRDLRPFLISANEILRADIPQKKFLVSTFIPSASFGMVFAPRGIGKSWFAFGLGKAIATGVDTFLGWQIHEEH